MSENERLHLTPQWRGAVRKLTGRCAYCITDRASCPHVVSVLKQRRREPIFNEPISVEQTALFTAMTRHGFDDDPVVGNQRAPFVPPSDNEIALAFAVMLEVADKLDPNGLLYDAPTLTGRAVQAALAVAQASMILQTRTTGRAEIEATHIVMGLARQFLASKPRTRSDQQGEKRRIRWEMGTLFLLAGSSGERVAAWLDCDRSALRKKYSNDLETFEHQFCHFCKNHNALRKKWQLPDSTIQFCYNDTKDRESTPTVPTLIDADFDAEPALLADLVDTVSRVLFDDE
ncbi:MAG: hypothetical protein ACLQJ0_06075 [Steroidobacteraceae bacterium]